MDAAPELPEPRSTPTPPELPYLPEEDPRTRMRRTLSRIPMLAFVLFLGYVASELVLPGVKVIVENKNTGEMREVRVMVMDQIGKIDGIPPAEDGSVRFRVKGKTPLTIEYINDQGRSVTLNAGERYFSGFHGTIVVRVKGDEIEPADADETSTSGK